MDVLNLQQIAALKGWTRANVHAYVQKGALKGYKLHGGHGAYFFTREQVDEFLASLPQKHQPKQSGYTFQLSEDMRRLVIVDRGELQRARQRREAALA